jgi:hypothetical protein
MDIHIAMEEVQSQLRRILASEGFARCPRMQRFLRFIVEESLAGRAEQLSEYVVGLAVFDRSAEFEPALDPIVRSDARRLRMKLLEYYQQAPADRIVITVPKGGYVPAFERAFRCSSGSVRINLIASVEGVPVWSGQYEGGIDELRSAIAADLSHTIAHKIAA